jgi:hypothetical protein
MVCTDEINIRVGARDFRTQRATITAFPHTVLYKALTFQVQVNTTDLAFWDRNEEVFGALLDYMRTGVFYPPAGMSFSKLDGELRFWGFELDTSPRCDNLFDIPKDIVGQPQSTLTTLPCPLGPALVAVGRGGHTILVCLAWAAIARSPAIWEAAAVGCRSIRLFWRVSGPYGTLPPGLLRDHVNLFQGLARADGCDIFFAACPVSGTSIPQGVHPQDVATRGFVSLMSEPKTVHVWTCAGHFIHHQTSAVLVASTPQRTSFLHRGYVITIVVQGQRCWWDFRRQEVDQFATASAESLESTDGFLLEMKMVVDTTILDVFHFPTINTRCATMEADLFYATKYTLPGDRPVDWYRSETRHQYAQAIYIDVAASEFKDADVMLLVEEKTRPTLACTKAAFVTDPDMYDVLTVAWPATP